MMLISNRYLIIITTIASVFVPSLASGHKTVAAAAAPVDSEPMISADSISLDPDVLRLTLENYCHLYTDVRQDSHGIKYGRSFYMDNTLHYYSNDNVAAIGSFNTRLVSIDKPSGTVDVKIRNIDNNEVLDYIFTLPVTINYDFQDKIYNGYGQHILDGDADVETIKIANSSIFKTYRDGALISAGEGGGGLEFLCSQNYGYLNIFITKQLGISASKTFFDAIKVGRAPWTTTITS